MTQRLNTIITTILLLTFFCSSNGQTKLSIKEQARKFVAKLKINDDYPMGGKDTLIDLNGDAFKDILIEFYALSGSGEKNGVQVYLYDKQRKSFRQCEQLNYLANPTFYRDRKVVVGYYVANGGGDATKMKWTGLQLDTLERIEINVSWANNNPRFKLVSYDYITKKRTVKFLDSMSLPKEYNYSDYSPIIRTNSR